MSQKRREFLTLAGLSSIAIMGAGFPKVSYGETLSYSPSVLDLSKRKYSQRFNMCGYAAPKINKVRIGFIGLGNRGPYAVERIKNIEGVEIKAICDLQETRVNRVKKLLEGSGHNPDVYFGSAYEWRKMCERSDLDLIYICTPWEWHVPMAVFSMDHGKHTAVEVPAATTLEGCWELVETSEKTKRHCMMLENCCYDFFELLTLNMARQGFFGDIIHGEGAYIHDLVSENVDKDGYFDMWRLKENFRDGNLYPTHGLGPICQIMDINRGDKMEFLTSVSSNDFQLANRVKELAEKDNFYTSYANKSYRGNMNTTTIKTKNGRTIMLQHDITSPRPYSRIHLISGTKGMACKYPEPPRISVGHSWLSADELKEIEKKYTPEIVIRIGEMAKKIGGHGGMDFMMDWRLIDCLRNGLPLDQDVYDAASWSAIAPLSEWSVANKSNVIDVPDFTGGKWETNQPLDLTLRGGGNTGVNILRSK